MKIDSDKQLEDTILQVKKYLLGKVKEDMGGVPLARLKKSKLVITEGDSSEEPTSELERIKSLIGGKCDEEPMEYSGEEDEDEDIKKIKAMMNARKGAK